MFLESKHLLHPESGFTLLETIIALAIMVVAFSAILSIESGSISASAKAKQLNVVAMLAKNKMVETEYAIQGKAFDEVKKEDGGTFATPFEDYRWKTEVKEIEFPSLNFSGGGGSSDSSSGGSSSGGGSVGGQDMGDLMTKLITQFLSQALREVSVSIIWKKGASDQQFALSTYWVDLNHEFQVNDTQ